MPQEGLLGWVQGSRLTLARKRTVSWSREAATGWERDMDCSVIAPPFLLSRVPLMEECRKLGLYFHHLAYLEQLSPYQFCPASCMVLHLFMSCAADSLQCWCLDDCDGTWLQLQLWSLNRVGWEARSRLIPACQPSPPLLPACGAAGFITSHRTLDLPLLNSWYSHAPSLLPAQPRSLNGSLTLQHAHCSLRLVLFCELAKISLHSPFLVLAKVLKNIGSSISGLLAGFYSAGQNPLSSQISTLFVFQLSSWHHTSLFTRRL